MGSRFADIVAAANSAQKKTDSVVFIYDQERIKKKPLCDLLKVDLSFEKKIKVSGMGVFMFSTKRGHSIALVSEKYARLVYKERKMVKGSKSISTKSKTHNAKGNDEKGRDRKEPSDHAETHRLKRVVSDDFVKTSLIDHNSSERSESTISLSVVRRWINPTYIPL